MNGTKLILMSGPIAVGKSTVRETLLVTHGFEAIRTGDLLKVMAATCGLVPTRRNLQELGDRLDSETDYEWVVEAADKHIRDKPGRWLFDSVRKHRQIAHFRDAYSTNICHVHLYANEEILRARYTARLSAGGGYGDAVAYGDAINHPNEIEARSLIDVADVKIDMGLLTTEEAAQRILREV